MIHRLGHLILSVSLITSGMAAAESKKPGG